MTGSPTNTRQTSCPVKLYLDRTLGDFHRTLSDVRLLFCSLIIYIVINCFFGQFGLKLTSVKSILFYLLSPN